MIKEKGEKHIFCRYCSHMQQRERVDLLSDNPWKLHETLKFVSTVERMFSSEEM